MSLVHPLAYGTNFGKAVPHWKIRDITWDQFCMLLQKPAASKSGSLSYIPGLIAPGPGVRCQCKVFLHRTKKTVQNRWAITLDADYLKRDGDPNGEELYLRLGKMKIAAAAHSTWSSSPGDARMRVIIPMSRPLSGSEYGPVVRRMMEVLGEGKFDKTCDQASRLFYLPAAQKGEYSLQVWRGPSLDADLWLDLAGGEDIVTERQRPEVSVGQLTIKQVNQLRALCTKVANQGEGNRDALLLWALKCVIDDGMDPEIAGAQLAEAAIYSGLEENVVWEKVGRVLG